MAPADMEKSVYDPNDDGIIAIAQGGTGASTASAARTNLGAQEASANLTALAAVAPGAAGLAILADATGADVAAYLQASEAVAEQGEATTVLMTPALSRAHLRAADWVFRPTYYTTGSDRVGEGDVDVDTGATEEMVAELSANGGHMVQFPALNYLINPIVFPINNTYIDARGAQFILNSTGVAFDFNPDADPTNDASVAATTKSYGYWVGGKFTSNQSAPGTMFAAFQAYAIRQMVWRDVVFGTQKDINGGSTSKLTDGIRLGGLGAHLVEKCRFYLVDKGIHGPDWSEGGISVSIPLTTCSFMNNEFILGTGDQAFYIDGGWERWKIFGGFVNGAANVAAFHFTDRKHIPRQLLIQGVGFEQATTNGQFVYLEDNHGTGFSDIAFRDCEFSGNPAGGGHTHIKLERTQKILLSNVRTTASVSTDPDNFAISMDANCAYLEIDHACRMTDPILQANACLDIHASVPRATLTFPSKRLDFSALTGYSGAAFSTSAASIDMQGNVALTVHYQDHGVHPRGYQLTVTARDSGSAAGTPSVHIGRTAADISGVFTRNTLRLAGVPNDETRTMSFYQPADPTTGDIYANIVATGAGTLDLWIYVNEIIM